MITVKYPLALTATLLWVGFVSAISFMEAWLKFRAPGVSLPIGLGIGRLVFSALNKVEWGIAIAIIANYIFKKGFIRGVDILFFCIPFIILIIQTCWLLPALDARVELYIQAKEVAPSNMHFYYIGMEVIKVTCLIIFGISLSNFGNTNLNYK